jgi:glycosyltransferase involved in cell wall biosynthesis
MLKGLNILYTTANFPYPLIGGDRIKQYYILKHLAENNNIFLVSFNRGYPVIEEYVKHLSDMGIKVYYTELNLFKSYLNGVIHSPFGNPLEIEFFRNKQFKSIIKEINQNNRIDFVINYFLRTTEYVKNIDCKKYLLAEDCRSYYQGRTYHVSKNLLEKSIRFYEARKLKKYESEITGYFDLTTLVSEEDRDEMQKLNPKANIKILSNGVDADRFKPAEKLVERKDIVFVGKLDVWVNNLMIDRITGSILPKILKTMPEVKLHIVGASPQKKHFRLQNDNIELHSDVPDIVPFLQESCVFLHPHIGGSGIQNKLLEAMACGCPVITTKSGARGINITNGRDGFVFETDEEIAEKTIQLLQNKEMVYEVGKNARDYIMKNHNWDNIFEELDILIEEIM